MHKNMVSLCGKTAGNLGTACAQVLPVQKTEYKYHICTRVMRQLYTHFSTGVLAFSNLLRGQLYPLPTGPIKTTTFYKNLITYY